MKPLNVIFWGVGIINIVVTVLNRPVPRFLTYCRYRWINTFLLMGSHKYLGPFKQSLRRYKLLSFPSMLLLSSFQTFSFCVCARVKVIDYQKLCASSSVRLCMWCVRACFCVFVCACECVCEWVYAGVNGYCVYACRYHTKCRLQNNNRGTAKRSMFTIAWPRKNKKYSKYS